jgi:hypothetical protein
MSADELGFEQFYSFYFSLTMVCRLEREPCPWGRIMVREETGLAGLLLRKDLPKQFNSFIQNGRQGKGLGSNHDIVAQIDRKKQFDGVALANCSGQCRRDLT